MAYVCVYLKAPSSALQKCVVLEETTVIVPSHVIKKSWSTEDASRAPRNRTGAAGTPLSASGQLHQMAGGYSPVPPVTLLILIRINLPDRRTERASSLSPPPATHIYMAAYVQEV